MLTVRLPMQPASERARDDDRRQGKPGERSQHDEGDEEQTFSWHRVVIALIANEQRAKQLYFGALVVGDSVGDGFVKTRRIGWPARIRLLS
jgi:hypothetical protein